MTVTRAYNLFRRLGLRHLIVVNNVNNVTGILTRKVQCSLYHFLNIYFLYIYIYKSKDLNEEHQVARLCQLEKNIDADPNNIDSFLYDSDTYTGDDKLRPPVRLQVFNEYCRNNFRTNSQYAAPIV